MTEQLKRAIELYEAEETVPYSREVIKDWLDDKIDTLMKVNKIYSESPLSLHMGKLDADTGRYELRFSPCGSDQWSGTETSLHIWSGIKELAASVGENLLEAPILEDDRIFYFYYRGIRVFELCEKGEELK